MREYENRKGQIVFCLDDNGDRYESFEFVVDYCRKNWQPHEIYYYVGFLDDAQYTFSKKGIEIFVEYSGPMGTEAKVMKDLPTDKLYTVRFWMEEIYEKLYSKNRP